MPKALRFIELCFMTFRRISRCWDIEGQLYVWLSYALSSRSLRKHRRENGVSSVQLARPGRTWAGGGGAGKSAAVSLLSCRICKNNDEKLMEYFVEGYLSG